MKPESDAGNAQDGDIGGLDEIEDERYKPIRGSKPTRANHKQECGICHETIFPGHIILKVQRWVGYMQVAAETRSPVEEASGLNAETMQAAAAATAAAPLSGKDK